MKVRTEMADVRRSVRQRLTDTRNPGSETPSLDQRARIRWCTRRRYPKANGERIIMLNEKIKRRSGNGIVEPVSGEAITAANAITTSDALARRSTCTSQLTGGEQPA